MRSGNSRNFGSMPLIMGPGIMRLMFGMMIIIDRVPF